MRLPVVALREVSDPRHGATRLVDCPEVEPGIREAPETAATAATSIPSLVSIHSPSKPALRLVARTLEIERVIDDSGATLTDYLGALRPQHPVWRRTFS